MHKYTNTKNIMIHRLNVFYSIVSIFLSFTGFLSQRQLQQSSGAGPHFQTGNLRDSRINAG